VAAGERDLLRKYSSPERAMVDHIVGSRCAGVGLVSGFTSWRAAHSGIRTTGIVVDIVSGVDSEANRRTHSG